VCRAVLFVLYGFAGRSFFFFFFFFFWLVDFVWCVFVFFFVLSISHINWLTVTASLVLYGACV